MVSDAGLKRCQRTGRICPGGTSAPAHDMPGVKHGKVTHSPGKIRYERDHTYLFHGRGRSVCSNGQYLVELFSTHGAGAVAVPKQRCRMVSRSAHLWCSRRLRRHVSNAVRAAFDNAGSPFGLAFEAVATVEK